MNERAHNSPAVGAHRLVLSDLQSIELGVIRSPKSLDGPEDPRVGDTQLSGSRFVSGRVDAAHASKKGAACSHRSRVRPSKNVPHMPLQELNGAVGQVESNASFCSNDKILIDACAVLVEGLAQEAYSTQYP